MGLVQGTTDRTKQESWSVVRWDYYTHEIGGISLSNDRCIARRMDTSEILFRTIGFIHLITDVCRHIRSFSIRVLSIGSERAVSRSGRRSRRSVTPGTRARHCPGKGIRSSAESTKAAMKTPQSGTTVTSRGSGDLRPIRVGSTSRRGRNAIADKWET